MVAYHTACGLHLKIDYYENLQNKLRIPSNNSIKPYDNEM